MTANKQKLKLLDIFKSGKCRNYITHDLVKIMRNNGYVVTMKWVNTICFSQQESGYLVSGSYTNEDGSLNTKYSCGGPETYDDFDCDFYWCLRTTHEGKLSESDEEDVNAIDVTKTMHERLTDLEKENKQLKEALLEVNKKLDEVWNMPGNPGYNKRKRHFQEMSKEQ